MVMDVVSIVIISVIGLLALIGVVLVIWIAYSHCSSCCCCCCCKKADHTDCSEETPLQPQTEEAQAEEQQQIDEGEKEIHRHAVPSPLRLDSINMQTNATAVDTLRAQQLRMSSREARHKSDRAMKEIKEAGEDRGSGRILLQLTYSLVETNLSVWIIRGEQLVVQSLNAQPEPYVKMQIYPDIQHTFRTRVARRGPNPYWNERFVFENILKDQLAGKMLLFTVASHNTIAEDEVIGELMLPLEFVCVNVEKNVQAVMWKFLQPRVLRYVGNVSVTLCYDDEKARLRVTINKAKLLFLPLKSKSPDTFVRLKLSCDSVEKLCLRTTIRSKTMKPRFDESMTMKLKGLNLRCLSLEVSMRQVAVTRDGHCVGFFVLGYDHTATDNAHWSQSFKNPRVPVTYWHHLLTDRRLDVSDGDA